MFSLLILMAVVVFLLVVAYEMGKLAARSEMQRDVFYEWLNDLRISISEDEIESYDRAWARFNKIEVQPRISTFIVPHPHCKLVQ